MTQTLAAPVRALNRSRAPKPEITRSDRQLVRQALAHVAAALTPKPAPDDFWHDLTRSDADARNVSLDAPVLRCRQALYAASQQGREAQAAAVHRVEVFFATLSALAVHGYQVTEDGGFETSLLELVEESSSVTVAAARARHEPTEGNLVALRFQAMESIEVSERTLDLVNAAIADVHTPLAAIGGR